ncbi:MAG: hypothetical protein OXU20_12170 [Myxococcales bacterium]|nr:hypothetical protein [Myxococcales bacterium]
MGFDHAGRRVLCAGMVLGMVACSSGHVMLQLPSSVPSARYRCQADGECEPAEVDPPTPESMPGATVLTVPDVCPDGFHQLVIYDADSSAPELGVTCASPDGAAPPVP